MNVEARPETAVHVPGLLPKEPPVPDRKVEDRWNKCPKASRAVISRVDDDRQGRPHPAARGRRGRERGSHRRG